MKAGSIQRHLTPYSLVGRRATTIRHAFASARAPVESYDESRVAEAMRVLGQRDMEALHCVYCKAPAETWDHLGALVLKSRPSGLGHTIGNLVPACKPCNSKRGNKPWESWMKARGCDARSIARVRAYHARYAAGGRLVARRGLTEAEDARLMEIERSILALMAKADRLLEATREAPSASTTGGGPRSGSLKGPARPRSR